MVKFTKIENGGIFTNDYISFKKNNELAFAQNKKIVVIYGPNGTGKTSLKEVLSDADGTSIEFEYDKQKYTSGKNVFHIISDQNNRNIIAGETKDFFLGDNIKRENELEGLIKTGRESLISAIVESLKKYGISSLSSHLIGIISTTPDVIEIIMDIANNKSKGKKFSEQDLIAKLATITVKDVQEYDDKKLGFLQKDIGGKESIIEKIVKVCSEPLAPNPKVRQIEENTAAIDILNRFHKDQCIVCDNEEIDWGVLLSSKTNNCKAVFDDLNPELKQLIEKLIALVPDNDPLQIKTRLIDAIGTGSNVSIAMLQEEIEQYKDIYSQLVLNDLAAVFAKSDLSKHVDEYQTLIDKKPELTQEDELYIQEIISNNMGKSLKVERDKKKNLRILLENTVILGANRNDLPLSTGEQNFLSLTFEFLKAKNSACPMVVIDDPVSSFDSIYKNKIVFAIARMLRDKKCILLTHNTDLLRLLHNQHGYCYNLYLLNNTDSGDNGFIALSDKEQGMLINLKQLLSVFRKDIFPYIKSVELFLISMIPFMRGYANIINDGDSIYESLTELMHGYNTGSVDLVDIYKKLFKDDGNILPNTYEVSVTDILAQTIEEIDILDPEMYPLLNKTLRHSFSYLSLRLRIEKTLVTKFQIDTSEKKQLGEIINAAYPNKDDPVQVRSRILLTSKKTLINEFNHFEGNLSIFQPAIDITDKALKKEQGDILTFVGSLQEDSV